MYPTKTRLEKCQKLLSTVIKSSDHKKELEFLFFTDKAGNFIITNQWNKTRRGRFYLTPKDDDWFIKFIFDNEFNFRLIGEILLNEALIGKLIESLNEYEF